MASKTLSHDAASIAQATVEELAIEQKCVSAGIKVGDHKERSLLDQLVEAHNAEGRAIRALVNHDEWENRQHERQEALGPQILAACDRWATAMAEKHYRTIEAAMTDMRAWMAEMRGLAGVAPRMGEAPQAA